MWSAAGGNRAPAPGAGLRAEPRASEYEESTEGSPGEGERVLGGGAPVTGVPRSAAPRGDAGRCRREGGAGPAQPLGRPAARPPGRSLGDLGVEVADPEAVPVLQGALGQDGGVLQR